jgi:osmotically-inducible protein OsmY
MHSSQSSLKLFLLAAVTVAVGFALGGKRDRPAESIPRQLPPGPSAAISTAVPPIVADDPGSRMEASDLRHTGTIQLTVGETQRLPDGESKQEVANRVACALRETTLAGFDIDIGVDQGVVTLEGTVCSAEQRDLAEQSVASVLDGLRIDNRLQVVDLPFPPAPIPRPPSGGEAARAQRDSPNQKLANKIASALKRAKITGFDIEIRVDHGVATLEGAVSSAEQRDLAEQAAASVDAGLRIDNRLQIVNVRLTTFAGSAPDIPGPFPTHVTLIIDIRKGRPFQCLGALVNSAMSGASGIWPAGVVSASAEFFDRVLEALASRAFGGSVLYWQVN